MRIGLYLVWRGGKPAGVDIPTDMGRAIVRGGYRYMYWTGPDQVDIPTDRGMVQGTVYSVWCGGP